MSVVPFRDDDDFRKHNQKAGEVASKELREFVEEIEALEAQIADLSRDKADIFTVAKSKGYNVKALRKLLGERKRNAGELAEEKETVELYRNLLL